VRVCVISNSHAASVKDGWDLLSSSMPNVDLTFFAAPNRGMASLKADYEAKKLYADKPGIPEFLSLTSNGLDVIDIEKYDAFFVYGLFLSVPRLDRRFSSAVKMATISDSVNKSINIRVVKKLVKMTDAPIYYSPNPLLSDVILNKELDSDVNYHDYCDICDWIDEYYAFDNTIQVKQIEQTMGQNLTTQNKFSTGAVRLSKVPKAQPSRDFRHMNAGYGELVLKMLVAEMAA